MKDQRQFVNVFDETYDKLQAISLCFSDLESLSNLQGTRTCTAAEGLELKRRGQLRPLRRRL